MGMSATMPNVSDVATWLQVLIYKTVSLGCVLSITQLYLFHIIKQSILFLHGEVAIHAAEFPSK